MTARDEVLARVRRALGDTDRAEQAPVPSRTGADHEPHADLVDLFAERVEDYRATVVRCTEDEVAAAIASALSGVASVVVPDGFPPQWLAGELDGIHRVEDSQLTAAALDRVDAVLSTAAVGIAATGTIVLDHGPGQGRRALSLVPDVHVCLVRAAQVVADVPSAVSVLDPGRPLTWVSGPSATSDIELDRVEGVHGPRTLNVIVVGPGG
jgi:L-lactate dehydrogenase complex protein LldG